MNLVLTQDYEKKFILLSNYILLYQQKYLTFIIMSLICMYWQCKITLHFQPIKMQGSVKS